MEIKEIISYFLNPDSNILEVSFRTIEDNEDTVRTDNIDYQIAEEYGYILESEDIDFFEEEFEEEHYDEEKIELDIQELIYFLNEYYTVNPHIIPKAEIY